MRSTKELLEVLLDQYENNRIDWIQWAGLCDAIGALSEYGLINSYEDCILQAYIIDNRPDGSIKMSFWWPMGETAPRIEFLKKLISEL